MKSVRDKIKNAAGIHRTGLELLKLAHKMDSSAIPLQILHALTQVAEIYLGLFLTARLIDSLLAGGFHRAFLYAGLLIVGTLCLETAGLLFTGAFRKTSNRLRIGLHILVREKAISLDYETMEQPGVAQGLARSERMNTMHGGLQNVIASYRRLLESLLTIAMAVGLTAAVCFAGPAAGGGFLARMAQPAVSVSLIALLSCATLAVYVRVNKSFMNKNDEVFQSHTDVEIKLSYMLGHILNDCGVGKVIRIYDMKEMLLGNFREFNEQSAVFFGKWNDVGIRGSLFRGMVNGFYVVCAYLFVAVKVLTGAVTTGAFTQYAGALTKLAKGFQDLVESDAELRRICLGMGDLLDFLHRESSHTEGSIPVEKRLDGEYEIEFRDVSFRYPGSEEMILKHVSCKLTMKNRLALVGKNGAGKTTFIKLLCRLYEPSEGCITLNGVDIRKYREDEYRELFSVVFQDFKLFAFPVWCNLVTGYERDDGKIQGCLERAGAAEFVRGLPQGADTLLYKRKEGGVDISGGEAQKLALARALYKDEPFVVLDEPTAALDPVSEAQVYAGFHEMVKDKTSIYISHRMSSCRFCDDIIVFDQGRIVERGSHEELLAGQGQYAKMWNAQAKYYAVNVFPAS